jgi:predicted nucleic-acid-binding Zn-ribbon protein
MSFKKEKRCPECHSTDYWHRREINIEFGYTGALWGTAVTPSSADFEQFTCANCGLTQFYATDLKSYAVNKHTKRIRGNEDELI